MTRRPRTWVWLGLVSLVALGAGLAATANTSVEAADHLDPPSRTSPDTAMGGTPTPDRAADIADVYAWHRGSGATASVVTILTFSGPNDPVADQAIPCDRDVLYTLHIDNTDDNTADFDIRARFGEDDLGNCFVQFEGVPGAGAGNIVAPVETAVTRGGAQVFAGLREDAFFFDLQGFRETLSTGAIAMTDDRDFFAGKNTPAIVVEFPLSAVSPTGQDFRVWATTARAGG